MRGLAGPARFSQMDRAPAWRSPLSVLLILLTGAAPFRRRNDRALPSPPRERRVDDLRLSLAHFSRCLDDDQSFALVRPRAGKFRERLRPLPRCLARRDPLASSGERLALGLERDGLAGALRSSSWPRLLFVRRVFPLKEGTISGCATPRSSARSFSRSTVLSMSPPIALGLFSPALFSSGRRNFVRSTTAPESLAADSSFGSSGSPSRRRACLVLRLAPRAAAPGPSRSGKRQARRHVANRGHRYDEAIAAADQGLDWAPLDWQLYFVRGVARIGLQQPRGRSAGGFPPRAFPRTERLGIALRGRQSLARLAPDASPSPPGAKRSAAASRMRPAFTRKCSRSPRNSIPGSKRGWAISRTAIPA